MNIYESEATGSTNFRVGSTQNTWGQPETSILYVDKNKLRFSGWTIPNNSISNAILNTEMIGDKTSQILVVESSLGNYQFILSKPFPKNFNFEFECEIKNNNTAIGNNIRKSNNYFKWYLIFIAVNIFLQVVLNVVES